MDFKLNHVPSCQPALVLIIRYRYRYTTRQTILAWRGVLTHPSHPPPLATGLPGASNSLVDFIMHEYLHKYFENIKKLDFFSYVT